MRTENQNPIDLLKQSNTTLYVMYVFNQNTSVHLNYKLVNLFLTEKPKIEFELWANDRLGFSIKNDRKAINYHQPRTSHIQTVPLQISINWHVVHN